MALLSIYTEAFLDSLLRQDAQLIAADSLNGTYVYRDESPPNTPYPNVNYLLQDATNYLSEDKTRLFSEFVYQVFVWGRAVNGKLENADRVRKAAHRLVEILSDIRRQSFSIDSTVFSFNVWFESELSQRAFEGETAEVTYKKFGGLFVAQIFQ